MLEIRPCSYQDAKEFVKENHRHNRPPVGHKFSIACYDGDRICGVAMVGRPVGRYLCLSDAGKLGIDIDADVRRKMEINKGRPWKHGKKG